MYPSSLPLFCEDIIDGSVTGTVTIITIGRDLSGVDYAIIMQSLVVESINLLLNYNHVMCTLYTKCYWQIITLTHNDNNSSNQERQAGNTTKEASSGKKNVVDVVDHCVIRIIFC